MPGDEEIILAVGLRPEDVLELRGLGCGPEAAVVDSVRADPTTTMVVTADNEPCAVFGVAPILGAGVAPGTGAPWFLATPRIYDVARQFADQTIYWVEWMNRAYPRLMNYMRYDNRVSRAWLRRAGFTIHPPQPIGLDGAKYSLFTRERI